MNELHCGIVAAGLGVESSVVAALDTHGLDHSVVQFAIPDNVPIYSVNGWKGPRWKAKLQDSDGPLVSKVRELTHAQRLRQQQQRKRQIGIGLD